MSQWLEGGAAEEGGCCGGARKDGTEPERRTEGRREGQMTIPGRRDTLAERRVGVFCSSALLVCARCLLCSARLPNALS
jgi:hypothetical protein